MISRDKVLEIVEAKGPVLPVRVVKELNTTLLIASAHLSELAASNLIMTSHMKIGNSPVYYVQGQEEALQDLATYLNEKDKEAFNLLKEKRILCDSDLTPILRVSMRSIKDFAKPMEIKKKDSSELVWKWYLLKEDETNKIIELYFSSKEAQRETMHLKHIETEKRKLEDERKRIEKEKKKLEEEKKILIEKQKEIVEQPKIESRPVQQEMDEFLEQIKKSLSEKKIEIIESKILKRNTEIELILKIPTVIGYTEYYCRAKNKKRVDESDLSAAFIQSQIRRLPALIIAPGDLTKKAELQINTELKNVAFFKINTQ